jgi:tartrate dehydratase alpha subunit/fumarate hydratase class I-like protein
VTPAERRGIGVGMSATAQTDIILATLLARLVERHGRERAAELREQLAVRMKVGVEHDLVGGLSRH